VTARNRLSALATSAALALTLAAAGFTVGRQTGGFVPLLTMVRVLFAVVLGTLGPLAVTALALAVALAAVALLLIGTALWKRGEILAG